MRMLLCVPKPCKRHGTPSTTPACVGAASPVQLQSSAVTCLTRTIDCWFPRASCPQQRVSRQSAKLSEAFPWATTLRDSKWSPGHSSGGLSILPSLEPLSNVVLGRWSPSESLSPVHPSVRPSVCCPSPGPSQVPPLPSSRQKQLPHSFCLLGSKYFNLPCPQSPCETVLSAPRAPQGSAHTPLASCPNSKVASPSPETLLTTPGPACPSKPSYSAASDDSTASGGHSTESLNHSPPSVSPRSQSRHRGYSPGSATHRALGLGVSGVWSPWRVE